MRTGRRPTPPLTTRRCSTRHRAPIGGAYTVARPTRPIAQRDCKEPTRRSPRLTYCSARSPGGGPNVEGTFWLVVVLGRAGADHGREVDHPPAHALPQRAPARPEPSPRRACRLPRPRRWRSHELALPNMRRRDLRAAAQHTLQCSRWACDCTDLNRTELTATRPGATPGHTAKGPTSPDRSLGRSARAS